MGDISAGDTNFSIEDTAAALLTADPAILEAAAAVIVAGADAGALRVAEQLALSGLTTTSDWIYSIEDSAAALLGADPDVLFAAAAVILAGGDAGTLTVAELITLATLTTDFDWIYSLADSADNLLESGVEDITSEISVSITSAEEAAEDLNLIDSSLSLVLDASAVTDIYGPAADIAITLSAEGIDTASDIRVTIDWVQALAVDLMTIGMNTTAVVDAREVTEISGAAADIAFVIESARIEIAPEVAITVDSGPAAAGDLNRIDSYALHAVNADAVTDIAGLAEDIATAMSADGIDTAPDVAVTVNGGTVLASDLISIDSHTVSVVDARAVSMLSGDALQIVAVLNSDGIDWVPDIAVKLNAGTMAAADLNNIDSRSTTAVDARLVREVSGSEADLLKLVGSTGITLAADYDVSITGSLEASALAVVDAANGSGTIRLLENLLESAYIVATPATSARIVADGALANIIDCPGAQIIHVASGGKLNLSGSDGNNVIVFDDYAPADLSVSHSGATVIFSRIADSAQIAWIATDIIYAPEQTIGFSDGTQVALTLVGSSLQLDGVAIAEIGEILP